MFRFFTSSLLTLGLLAGAVMSQSTGTTQIFVSYRNAVDKPMVNATSKDAEVTVDITFEKPDGSKVDVQVKSTIVGNVTTRRDLATDIANKLKDKLQQHGLPVEWVNADGAGVTARSTPPGVGKNTGTKDSPVISPKGATNNHGHVKISSKDARDN